MNNFDQNFKGKPLLIFFLIIVGIAIYQLIINKKIDNNGIYTKCTLINSEGYKGGIIITIKYKYKGNEYTGRLNCALSKTAIGNQYFIKLLSENPNENIFIREFSVPDCLLTIAAPPEGWKEIPGCK